MPPSFDVFLSHNSQDKAVVRQLKQILSGRGLHCWLDEDELPPGEDWQQLIEDGIKQSKAIAVCFGPSGVGPWEYQEMRAALIRAVKQGKTVIPVILPNAPREPDVPMFLEMRTWANLRDLNDQNSLDKLIWGITGIKPDAIGQTRCWQGNPYRSLEPFRPEHAAIFFGRDPETRQLLERLRSGQRLLAVIGASGSGKSSLVGAGLLAKLANDALPGSSIWPVIRFTPAEETDNPFLTLANRLWPMLLTYDRPVSAIKLADELASQPAKIKDHASAILTKLPNAELLLFIDQFEELFTDRVNADCREPFADLVAVIADSRRLRLVLTLRADFYDRCLQYPVLKPLLTDGHFPLFSPDDFALKDIIERPARLVGIEPNDQEVRALINQLGKGDGRLALLEFTLARLFDLSGGKALNLKDCKIEDAIEIQGNQALKAAGAISDPDLWAVYNALADVDDSGNRIRRRVWLDSESFTPPQRHLLEQLERARLLTSDRDPQGRPWLEVAHEKVLTAWQPLFHWLEANAEFKRWRKRLDIYRKDGEYLRGNVLRKAEDMQQRWGEKLDAAARGFIEESQAQRDLEMAEQRRQRFNEIWLRRLNIAAGGLGIVLLLVAGFSVWVEWIAEVPWSAAAIALKTRGQCSINICPDWVPEMVDIPADTYLRGSPEADIQAGLAEEYEGPQTKVSIKAFKLGKTEVTRGQFQVFADDRNYRCKQFPKQSTEPRTLEALDDGQLPETDVSWLDAQCYAEWLSFVTGRDYRLPSEAEWEYAARAGTATASYWGDDDPSGYAWFAENSNNRPHKVGQKKPNQFGLYDMLGNVWEWTADCWHENYRKAPVDGSVWQEPQHESCQRVLRGGSWSSFAYRLRSADRGGLGAGDRSDGIGFRLAQD